ncbi:MAG: DUF3786 domain-containing protein [Candidatus Omnitrophica bacterium]|nr:DUF3786 domain-containing protein [Candidatus Omnitrophota bacterium]
MALKKAWEDLANLKAPNNLSVKFMADEYALELPARSMVSVACNIPAKDFLSILILHYLAQKLKGLPGLTGQWLSFREISGIQGYYDAYYKRSIDPIIRKYGKQPDTLVNCLSRLPAKLSAGADISIVVEVFAGVPVLIRLWKADAEFAADANIYFDASIKDIFCIEDVVVLAQLVASQL